MMSLHTIEQWLRHGVSYYIRFCGQIPHREISPPPEAATQICSPQGDGLAWHLSLILLKPARPAAIQSFKHQLPGSLSSEAESSTGAAQTPRLKPRSWSVAMLEKAPEQAKSQLRNLQTVKPTALH